MNVTAKLSLELQKTSVSVGNVGGHMLMLNSFSNPLKCPKHLVLKKGKEEKYLRKYLQIVFHPACRRRHTVSG